MERNRKITETALPLLKKQCSRCASRSYGLRVQDIEPLQEFEQFEGLKMGHEMGKSGTMESNRCASISETKLDPYLDMVGVPRSIRGAPTIEQALSSATENAGQQMASKPTANEVVAKRYLIIGHHEFRCPYCGRSFERGGRKEGFVKSGANNHVYACWESKLYLAGYIVGGYSDAGSHEAIPVASVDHKDPGWKRYIRGIKANLATRRRAGVPWALATGATP